MGGNRSLPDRSVKKFTKCSPWCMDSGKIRKQSSFPRCSLILVARFSMTEKGSKTYALCRMRVGEGNKSSLGNKPIHINQQTNTY
jgi:hypothetical protein